MKRGPTSTVTLNKYIEQPLEDYYYSNLNKYQIQDQKKMLCHPKLLYERVMGIEPTSHPWEGRILPVNYTRILTLASIIITLVTPDYLGSVRTFPA